MEKRCYIGYRCKRLSVLAGRCISQTLGDLDLTPAQSRVVMHLVSTREHPPCQRELEELFSLSHPTVSGILSRLEEKGYLQFAQDPEDRRRKRIVATEKAMICAHRTKAVLEGIEEQMLQGFTPAEREAFSQFLDRATKNLGCDQQTGKEQA